MTNFVDIHVPFLLGLDLLTDPHARLNIGKGKLADTHCRLGNVTYQNLGHLYIEWQPSVLFPVPELRKILQKVFHTPPARVSKDLAACTQVQHTVQTWNDWTRFAGKVMYISISLTHLVESVFNCMAGISF